MATICLFGLISKHPGRNRGGVALSLARLAEFFAAEGHAVHIVARRPADGAGPCAGLAPAVRCHFTARSGRLGVFAFLLGVVRRTRPDTLLAFDTRANQVASWLRWTPAAPPSLWLSLRNALNPRHRAGLRRAALRADGVIAISHGLAREFVGLTGIDASRVYVIHNPAVTPPLARLAATPVSHRWIGEGQPPLVVAAGRLTPQKDYPTLLRAFAGLRGQRPCRLMILGDGELRDDLQRLAGELGIEDDVDLAGFHANPWPFMRHAAVFVLSSAWEGFGNVLAEALSLGVPVVSTDCPHGPREILDDGRLGRLVPVGDAAALADAIAATLDHPPDRATLVEGARPFAQATAGAAYLGLLLDRRPAGGRAAVQR